MPQAVFLTIALLVASFPAFADEVQFGVRSESGYDSAVANTNGSGGDAIVTVGPELRIEGEHPRWSYQIDQFSGYETYVDRNNLDGWRLQLGSSLRYVLSPHAQIQVSNRFNQLPRLRLGTQEQITAGSNGTGLDYQAGSVTSDAFSTTFTVVPTERLTGTSQFSVFYLNSDTGGPFRSRDTLATTVLNQVDYRLSKHHGIGGGFRFSSRDFQTILPGSNGVVGEQQDATTQTWEGFASWRWIIDGRSTFVARAGPAFSSDDVNRQLPSEFPAYSVVLRRNTMGEVVGFLQHPAGCPMENNRAGNTVVLNAACDKTFVVDQTAATTFQDGITGQALTDLIGLRTTLPGVNTSSGAANATNLFFGLSLDRRWERFSTQASWTRSDSQTQSLGSNTVVDSFQLNSRYDVSKRGHIGVRFRFTRRESKVDREVLALLMSKDFEDIMGITTPPGADPVVGFPIVGVSAEDGSFTQRQDTYYALFRYTRQWGRYSNAFVGFSLRRQETTFTSALAANSFKASGNSWQIQLGVNYRFRPIRFHL